MFNLNTEFGKRSENRRLVAEIMATERSSVMLELTDMYHHETRTQKIIILDLKQSVKAKW